MLISKFLRPIEKTIYQILHRQTAQHFAPQNRHVDKRPADFPSRHPAFSSQAIEHRHHRRVRQIPIFSQRAPNVFDIPFA